MNDPLIHFLKMACWGFAIGCLAAGEPLYTIVFLALIIAFTAEQLSKQLYEIFYKK